MFGQYALQLQMQVEVEDLLTDTYVFQLTFCTSAMGDFFRRL